MALELIIGNSGSGKSYTAYQKVIEASIRYPRQKFLVIVPEQFTMQTQKELVSLHPKKGILNIDVLSFQRLAYHVFDEVGADKRTVLEETGKSLLLKKVALEQQEQLQVLGGNLRKIGYISEMKSIISELTQYDVTLEQMDEMIAFSKDMPGLCCKLQDIQVLYRGFREKLQKKYMTSEEILGALCDVAEQSEMLKDSTIVLDGFTGFTPVQLKLIHVLMRLTKELIVTVTMDVKEDPWEIGGMHELFYLSRKTIKSLKEIAAETGTEIADPVFLGEAEKYRFRNSEAMAFLEKHFMRHDRSVYEKEQQAVSIHMAANAVEEAHFAARTIMELVRREGYRYQDIAVITGDMASYGTYVGKVFEEYGIPAFLDQTKTILLNPFIEFIRAALDMVEKNFSYESVFGYLRTGLCGLSNEETDLLENYVIATGKRGLGAWKKEWEKPARTMGMEKVELCEALRQKVLQPILPFAAGMKKKKATAREKTETLYELIVAHKIQEQLAKREQEFTKMGNLEAAREYHQIYRIMMELLEKITELLGEEYLTVREYREILEAGFEEAKVGIIPPTADRVVVGDMERTRLKSIRALIFLGLNDGWVPKSAGRTGILSEPDRDSLKECKVELAPGAREEGYIQRFYLYQNLTKPSEKLFLSFSKAKTDGTSMRKSYVIHRVSSMFAHIPVIDEDRRQSLKERLTVPENGIPYLIRGIKGEMDEEEFAELYNWYFQQKDYADRLKKLVEAAYLTGNSKGLGREISRALYGETLENSVSRLERFAACAYAHFLMYGLALAPREQYEFQPVDMGNIFHKVLEIFSVKLEQSDYTWQDLPEELLQEWSEECVRQVAEEYGGDVLHSSARNAYMIQRMKRIMKRTLWALREQVRAGMFLPQNYEVSFSMAEDLKAVNIALSEKEKMKLKGRIDRIDTCEKEEQVYVKVIDYKSGNTEFDMVALYYGLQLQLVVYLNAAMELEKRIYPGKEIIPAGIFYYRMQDPVLDRMEPELINEEILKKLKLNGLVNEDPEVVHSLDQNLSGASTVIPVSLNKDGSYSRYSSIATKEQFASLSAYVHDKMKDIGSRILAGEVQADPYERNGKTACDYCSYHEVCGFDPRIPEMGYQRLKEYSPKEIWEKMEGGIEHGHDMDR